MATCRNQSYKNRPTAYLEVIKGEPNLSLDFCVTVKNGKGSPYSITERRVPKPIPVLGSQHAGDVSHKPGGRLALLSARPQLPSQPYKFRCLVNRGMMDVNSLPKTVTRQHRSCDLNPSPSALESSMPITWLPSHPYMIWVTVFYVCWQWMFAFALLGSISSAASQDNGWENTSEMTYLCSTQWNGT